MDCTLFTDPLFRSFADKRPFATVTQMVLRRLLAAQELDGLFESEAQRQYFRLLRFSDLTGLVSGVVLGKYRSMNAGYKALQDQLGVSVRAVYDKLQGVELSLSRELVRNSYRQTVEVCKEIGCVQTTTSLATAHASSMATGSQAPNIVSKKPAPALLHRCQENHWSFTTHAIVPLVISFPSKTLIRKNSVDSTQSSKPSRRNNFGWPIGISAR